MSFVLGVGCREGRLCSCLERLRLRVPRSSLCLLPSSPASWALPPLPSSSQSSGVSPQPMSPPQCALHEQAHFCAHAQRVSEHPRRPHAPRSVRLHPVTLLKPGGRAQLQHQTEPVICNRRGSRPQGREAEPAKRASHQSPPPPQPLDSPGGRTEGRLMSAS